MSTPRVVKDGRKLVKRGVTPRFRVDLSARKVHDLPWLEFDGSRPAAVAEAARRAIAAELGVRADQVEVEVTPSNDEEIADLDGAPSVAP